MSILNIEATRSTPAIHLDPGTGRLEITGESCPKNASVFYEPVLRDIQIWLDTDPPRRLDVIFVLPCYSSSSSRAIMNLMDLLEAAAGRGWAITIRWRFHEKNDIIRERGEELRADYESLRIELNGFTD
jgi:hypothetical protein